MDLHPAQLLYSAIHVHVSITSLLDLDLATSVDYTGTTVPGTMPVPGTVRDCTGSADLRTSPLFRSLRFRSSRVYRTGTSRILLSTIDRSS